MMPWNLFHCMIGSLHLGYYNTLNEIYVDIWHRQSRGCIWNSFKSGNRKNWKKLVKFWGKNVFSFSLHLNVGVFLPLCIDPTCSKWADDSLYVSQHVRWNGEQYSMSVWSHSVCRRNVRTHKWRHQIGKVKSLTKGQSEVGLTVAGVSFTACGLHKKASICGFIYFPVFLVAAASWLVFWKEK